MMDVIFNWLDELGELIYKIGKGLCRLADRLDNTLYKIDKKRQKKKMYKLMTDLDRLCCLEKIETENLKALEHHNNSLGRKYVWYIPYWEEKIKY